MNTNPSSPLVDLSTFVPTTAMLDAFDALAHAIMHVVRVRPIVEAYQGQILAERDWFVSPTMAAGLRLSADTRITTLQHLYLMSPSDLNEFDLQCRTKRDLAGLAVEDETHCPLLVAEKAVQQAENHLIDVTARFTGITTKNLVSDLRRRLISFLCDVLQPYATARAQFEVTVQSVLDTFWAAYLEAYPEVTSGDSCMVDEPHDVIALWVAQSKRLPMDRYKLILMEHDMDDKVPADRFTAALETILGAVRVEHGLAEPSQHVRAQLEMVVSTHLYYNFSAKPE